LLHSLWCRFYGNYVKDQVGFNNAQLAEETVAKLVALYPPAKTKFQLKQESADPFGSVFVKGLRDRGYAVAEFDKNAKEAPPLSDAEILTYLVDHAGDDLYRVTVTVGDAAISRAYSVEQGALVAAGSWARKE